MNNKKNNYTKNIVGKSKIFITDTALAAVNPSFADSSKTINLSDESSFQNSSFEASSMKNSLTNKSFPQVYTNNLTSFKTTETTSKSEFQIFGISSKSFIDFQSFKNNAHLIRQDNEYITAYSKGKLSTPSFRPMNNIYSNYNLINSTKLVSKLNFAENSSQSSQSVSDAKPVKADEPILDYKLPWKLSSTYDYEQLESNNVTSSLANISTATSFSDILGTDDNRLTSNFINKNELISRSTQLTQELELRLRERRQIIESKSDKYRPKLLHHIDILEIAGDEKPTHDDTKDQAELKQPMPSFKACPDLTAIFHNCHCSCHLHDSSTQCDKSPSLSHYSSGKSYISTVKSSNGNKKAKIIIDGSTSLPSKRESIRLLIENKTLNLISC